MAEHTECSSQDSWKQTCLCAGQVTWLVAPGEQWLWLRVLSALGLP